MANTIKEMATYNSFSPLEKEIINYIFIHSDEIANMSIDKLAKNTFSSNSSIIRMCKKLGFKGYKEFKIAFIQDLEKNRTEKNTIDFNIPFHALSSPNEIAYDISILMKLTIEKCYMNIDTKKLYQISEVIVNSNHRYCYSSGHSLIRMESFENKLIKLGIYLNNATIRWDAEPYSYYATQNDCAIFLTYSSRNQVYLKNAQILKAKGCKIIVITSNQESQLSQLADYLYLIPNYENNIDNIAEFYSQTAFEYILNTIYSFIYKIHYENNSQSKHRLEEIRLKKMNNT